MYVWVYLYRERQNADDVSVHAKRVLKLLYICMSDLTNCSARMIVSMTTTRVS